ncbi:MAG: 50S ribosomal protein L29 [gamma proteobacterium symbiont of Bathyaustriella thionipta]|nr:50S ribosomal protein L29 [gamma proteobacterium symbiont of Bathyaustriella thionipta]RKZ94483.1 MAG: 50S ribosomal protein L29 [Gammaproteobacteria bacterium]MCU7949055.1 50S ribosomal protein L29 [gamma proteobacterium symbiont of Bathyaustriella thionipta]MCU7952582.1 50S ribosomal protein L29 [gamma proteobacterium symbiont of Bathyaustriella thionipta]MCU7955662.1 50S ribosomal protein L29 [gamma proteobacterium symbiont of Bathyaustriella thionipta]
MKANDLQAKSPEELTETLHELRKEQFNLRMGQGSGQQVKPHLFKLVRRNIARVKTVLSSK